jgi:hypothetical protein
LPASASHQYHKPGHSHAPKSGRGAIFAATHAHRSNTNYTIGGFQVIKKWLSYREFGLLERPLTPDEAREVTHTARRIAALVLLQPELDKNYVAVKGAPLSL